MAKVSVDVEELEFFEKFLRDHSNQMRDDLERLRAQMVRIDTSWQDDNNRAFMDDFIPKTHTIMQLADQLEEYSNFVRVQRMELEDYLSRARR